MTKEEMELKVRALDPWFHYIELPYGIKTRECKDITNDAQNHPVSLIQKLQSYLPEDPKGLRIFDMGCNGGAIALHLAQRGAKVLASDFNARYVKQTELIAEIYAVQDRIDVLHASVEDMPTTLYQPFDFVLGLGLIYHTPNPIKAVKTLAAYTKIGGYALFESNCSTKIPDGQIEFLGQHKPYLAVWRYSPKAILDVLEFAGFKVVEYKLISGDTRILAKVIKV